MFVKTHINLAVLHRYRIWSYICNLLNLFNKLELLKLYKFSNINSHAFQLTRVCTANARVSYRRVVVGFAFRIDVVTKCRVRGQSTVDRSKNFVRRLFGFCGVDLSPLSDGGFEVTNRRGTHCIQFAAGNQSDLSLNFSDYGSRKDNITGYTRVIQFITFSLCPVDCRDYRLKRDLAQNLISF